MPAPKQKPKNVSTPPPGFVDNLKRELGNVGQELMHWLFGVTLDWQKQNDMLNNNFELALRHFRLGNFNDVILRCKIVTWLNPKHAEAWYYLGRSYLALGKMQQAIHAFDRSLQLKPGREEAIYLRSIAKGGRLSAGEVPKRIPLSLVQEHFDTWAPDYNKDQVESGYEGHILLSKAIHAAAAPGRTDHMVLDLGAGTGLLGPLIRDIAASITGVDISNKMIDQAVPLKDTEARIAYATLVKRDFGEYLQGVSQAFDIVAAANVVGYVGELSVLFQQVAHVLKPGGLFALTADASAGADFSFDIASGRFHYSQSYLQAVAHAAGFTAIVMEEAASYPDYKTWVCVFRKG